MDNETMTFFSLTLCTTPKKKQALTLDFLRQVKNRFSEKCLENVIVQQKSMKAGLGSRSYMGIGPIEFYNVGNSLGNKLTTKCCCFKYT